MRIALVRRKCGFMAGGAERYMAYLAKALVKLGHKPITIGEAFESIPNVSFAKVSPSVRGSIAKNLVGYILYTRFIKRNHSRFDVVFSGMRIGQMDFFCTLDPLHLPWLYAQNDFKKARITRFLPRHTTILFLEKLVFGNPRVGIVVYSEKVKNELLQYYGVPENRIFKVASGVDTEVFRPSTTRRPGPGRQLLFVGNHSENKGLERLLRACTCIRHRNFSVKIVGPVEKLRSSYPFGVDLVGRTVHPEHYYRYAHFVVIPSRYETFSQVCLEAMACGTPPIVSANAGASELVEHGVSGFVVKDPENIEELRTTIEYGLDLSDQEWRNMSKAASQIGTSRSWEDHASDLISIFEKARNNSR
ncbi:MAG: glycosyltransferase family 4 protein [Deltaproteobacteria bacterium]|nr:glycosyltransferase family 4 protein [Deltaproteobacteria bacterium]